MKKNGLPNLYLVCEGKTDERLLAALIQRLLRAKRSGAIVSLMFAGAKLAVPGHVRALERRIPPGTPLGMVVSSDGSVEGTESFLRRNLDLREYFVVIAHPSLESWFNVSSDQVYRMLKDPKQIQEIIDRTDLERLAREHPEFNLLVEVVTNLKTKPKRVARATFVPPKDLHPKLHSER